MSDTVRVALISGAFTLICSALTLVGVLINAKSNKDKISQEMEKKIAVIDTKIEGMNKKIEEHNGYAKMFSENIPAIKQHLTDIDARLNRIDK